MRKRTEYWSGWSNFIECNLVERQCQRKSEVLYTFTPKSYESYQFYGYFLNVEWNSMCF